VARCSCLSICMPALSPRSVYSVLSCVMYEAQDTSMYIVRPTSNVMYADALSSTSEVRPGSICVSGGQFPANLCSLVAYI
jgi:uncharacterized RmlC-like cupin family protein